MKNNPRYLKLGNDFVAHKHYSEFDSEKRVYVDFGKIPVYRKRRLLFGVSLEIRKIVINLCNYFFKFICT